MPNNNTVEAWKQGTPATTRVVYNSVHISPSNIYENSLTITESICEENALQFVGCIPSVCEIKIRGESVHTGATLEVYTRAGDTEEIKLFTGKIDSVSYDAKKEWAKVQAFDELYDIKNKNVSAWYAEQTFPQTLQAFRNSFFQMLQVEQEETTLINDGMIIEETIGGEDITGGDIIEAICQINAVFGMMNREGVFSYIDLNPNRVNIEVAQIRSLNYEEYTTAPISKVQVRETSDDVGAIVGSGDNAYIIEGNILAYGKTSQELETIATLIYNKISGTQYTPASSKINGAPYLTPGDAVVYEPPNGNLFYNYILSRKITGFVSFVDEIKTPGVLNYAEAITSANNSLIQLRGQSNRLQRTVEGLTSTVQTIRSDYASKSELQQTSESITAQIEYIQNEIDGSLTTYYTEEPPTLTNYPAYDFTYNIICGVTELTEGLHFEYTEEGYQKNLRALVYDKVHFLGYRFVKQDNVWGWMEIADTEYGVIMQKISTLEMTAEEITGKVTRIENDYITSSELTSAISLKSDEILLSVSATYTTKDEKNTLQSQITQNATSISAKVSKSGGTTGSNSFSWELYDNYFSLKSGNAEKFRCDASGVRVNGEIITTSGSIGGWTINSASINNGIPYTGEKNSNATGIGGYGGGWAFWAGNGKFSVKQDGSLYAESATINGYTKTQDLEAVNARFNNLNASNITAGTLSVERLNITAIMVNMAGKSLGVSELTAGSVKAINALLMTYNTRQIQVYADATGFMKWRYT